MSNVLFFVSRNILIQFGIFLIQLRRNCKLLLAISHATIIKRARIEITYQNPLFFGPQLLIFPNMLLVTLPFLLLRGCNGLLSLLLNQYIVIGIIIGRNTFPIVATIVLLPAESTINLIIEGVR